MLYKKLYDFILNIICLSNVHYSYYLKLKIQFLDSYKGLFQNYSLMFFC